MNSDQKHNSRNVMRSGFLIKDVKKGEKLSKIILILEDLVMVF